MNTFKILSISALLALCATACSDPKFEGDAPVDRSGNTDIFLATESESFSTFYKPAIGRVGDPMPFFDPKSLEFKVLYLQEYNANDDRRFHPFWGVKTTDGCNYESLGEVLAVGSSRLQQDAALGTGCVYYDEDNDLYYIYYTAHNGDCSSREVIMRATSHDFKTWTRDIIWELRGEPYGFSGESFRDPHIFEEDGVYHMVISTTPNTPTPENPCFAEFTSTDMKNWEFCERFDMVWDRFLECPDIFKMGDYWYLVYSDSYKADFGRKVKYMMGTSWQDLKSKFDNPAANWPKDDKEGILDSRAFYAAKTAYNGTDRYIWGWTPFRSGVTYHDKNINVGEKEPNWSGSLVCHKLIQHENGTLSVGEVPAMAAKYNKQLPVKVMDQTEDHTLYSRLADRNHISFTVVTEGDVRWGVSFARTIGDEKYYSFIVNPEWDDKSRRKVNFEQQGPDSKGFIPGGDGYIFPRPADNTYKVDIYTENSVVVMYINGIYGYTQRVYAAQQNCWSINNYGNNITVTDLKVTTY